MRALGQILMWLGFLGGSFASVSQLELTDDKWATVPWIWYSIAMGIGMVGIVLLRRAKQEDHSDDAKTEAEYFVIQQSLAKLSTAVETLCQTSQPEQGTQAYVYSNGIQAYLTASGQHAFTIIFMTGDAWPATLPGTPWTYMTYAEG